MVEAEVEAVADVFKRGSDTMLFFMAWCVLMCSASANLSFVYGK
jgi:hypothetical protein